MEMFKLSQTVAGTWVITTPNPEERGWETQLAEFDMSATLESTPAGEALANAAAYALVALVRGILIDPNDEQLVDSYCMVTSHDTNAAARMEVRVKKAANALRYSVDAF